MRAYLHRWPFGAQVKRGLAGLSGVIDQLSYIGIAFKAATVSQYLMRTTPQIRIPDHKKCEVYKIICNTCHKAYVGQTSRDIRTRFWEHICYIKNNDPRSAYALHILNCRHEYGNIKDTMTLLKQINKPNLLFPYEKMYIQSLYHNNDLSPKQHPNEFNPTFQLLHINNTHCNQHDNWSITPLKPASPLLTCAQNGHLRRYALVNILHFMYIQLLSYIIRHQNSIRFYTAFNNHVNISSTW